MCEQRECFMGCNVSWTRVASVTRQNTHPHKVGRDVAVWHFQKTQLHYHITQCKKLVKNVCLPPGQVSFKVTCPDEKLPAHLT